MDDRAAGKIESANPGTAESVKKSPFPPDHMGKRAIDNKVFILKNGNTRSNSRGGNSAIISPWGILSQAKDEMNTKLVSADLDIAKLREYRRVTTQ